MYQNENGRSAKSAMYNQNGTLYFTLAVSAMTVASVAWEADVAVDATDEEIDTSLSELLWEWDFRRNCRRPFFPPSTKFPTKFQKHC